MTVSQVNQLSQGIGFERLRHSPTPKKAKQFGETLKRFLEGVDTVSKVQEMGDSSLSTRHVKALNFRMEKIKKQCTPEQAREIGKKQRRFKKSFESAQTVAWERAKKEKGERTCEWGNVFHRTTLVPKSLHQWITSYLLLESSSMQSPAREALKPLQLGHIERENPPFEPSPEVQSALNTMVRKWWWSHEDFSPQIRSGRNIPEITQIALNSFRENHRGYHLLAELVENGHAVDETLKIIKESENHMVNILCRPFIQQGKEINLILDRALLLIQKGDHDTGYKILKDLLQKGFGVPEALRVLQHEDTLYSFPLYELFIALNGHEIIPIAEQVFQKEDGAEILLSVAESLTGNGYSIGRELFDFLEQKGVDIQEAYQNARWWRKVIFIGKGALLSIASAPVIAATRLLNNVYHDAGFDRLTYGLL